MQGLYPKIDFIGRFNHINNLAEQGEWRYQAGMEFGSLIKWWQNASPRKYGHEGLDFCYFKEGDGQLLNAVGFKIPALTDGVIRRICPDFLGQSIFMAHPAVTRRRAILYSMYGHCLPLAGMGPGMSIKGGRQIATVAKAQLADSAPPPHLHLSLAWIDKGFADNGLDWQILVDSQAVEFIDPLVFILYESI